MMKKVMVLGLLAGAVNLGACSNSPQEQAASNIEANAESVADNLEDAADNASSSAAADSLENQADVARNMGDAAAEDMTTNDPDTNLANGM